MRRAATLELKARGMGFMLVRDSDSTAADMRKDPGLWGITELANAGGVRFYRID
jgi:hypothetical protein